MNNLTITLFDVIPYLQDRGIEYHTEGKNVTQGWIEIQCPWCTDDPSHHLGINKESNFINCWRCGHKGNVVKLVRHLEGNCSFPEALNVMDLYQDTSRIYLQQEERTFQQSLEIPKNFKKLSQIDCPIIVLNFLHLRGFNPKEILVRKELYYGGHVGDFSFRLILPVTYRNKLVTWVGRALSNGSNLPYKNLPDEKSVIPIKSTLYGYDEAPPGGNLVVVEGPLDQWKLEAGSLATYGIMWTMNQVSRIRELTPNKVWILFDNEDEAQESAIKLNSQLWFCDSEVLCLEGHKDPGELTLEEGKEVMKELMK